jgi:hypothetical protein
MGGVVAAGDGIGDLSGWGTFLVSAESVLEGDDKGRIGDEHL